MRKRRNIARRPRARKLTSSALRKLVLSEARKLQRESMSGNIQDVSKVKADEYEPGEEADTIEKDIDFIKVLKIQETTLSKQHKKLVKRMRKLQERKALLRKRIIKNI